MNVLEGKVWVFPGNVTTDEILPGQYLDRSNDEVGQFAMAGADSEFVNKISNGDFIVAGSNFGSGSGRESAPIANQQAGIAAVIAPSFARLFFRNSINVGLPAVIIPSIEDILEGDQLSIDLEKTRMVTNLRTENQYAVQNLLGTSREILQAGGIVAYTKQRMAAERNGSS